MPPFKVVKTYEKKDRSLLSNSKSVEAVNALFAQNLTKRILGRRKKPKLKLKELPPRTQPYLTDDSLKVDADDTFDQVLKGKVYNKVEVNSKPKVNASSESDASKRKIPQISVTFHSPIMTRRRRKQEPVIDEIKNTSDSKDASLKRSKHNHLDKSITGSISIEKENKKLTFSSLSYIQIPKTVDNKTKEDSHQNFSGSSKMEASYEPVFSDTFRERQTVHSSTPYVEANPKKIVVDPISPIFSKSSQGSPNIIEKSYDEIRKWETSFPIIDKGSTPKSVLSQGKSRATKKIVRRKLSSITEPAEKENDDDWKLKCSPKVHINASEVIQDHKHDKKLQISPKVHLTMNPVSSSFRGFEDDEQGYSSGESKKFTDTYNTFYEKMRKLAAGKSVAFKSMLPYKCRKMEIVAVDCTEKPVVNLKTRANARQNKKTCQKSQAATKENETNGKSKKSEQMANNKISNEKLPQKKFRRGRSKVFENEESSNVDCSSTRKDEGMNSSNVKNESAYSTKNKFNKNVQERDKKTRQTVNSTENRILKRGRTGNFKMHPKLSLKKQSNNKKEYNADDTSENEDGSVEEDKPRSSRFLRSSINLKTSRRTSLKRSEISGRDGKLLSKRNSSRSRRSFENNSKRIEDRSSEIFINRGKRGRPKLTKEASFSSSKADPPRRSIVTRNSSDRAESNFITSRRKKVRCLVNKRVISSPASKPLRRSLRRSSRKNVDSSKSKTTKSTKSYKTEDFSSKAELSLPKSNYDADDDDLSSVPVIDEFAKSITVDLKVFDNFFELYQSESSKSGDVTSEEYNASKSLFEDSKSLSNCISEEHNYSGNSKISPSKFVLVSSSSGEENSSVDDDVKKDKVIKRKLPTYPFYTRNNDKKRCALVSPPRKNRTLDLSVKHPSNDSLESNSNTSKSEGEPNVVGVIDLTGADKLLESPGTRRKQALVVRDEQPMKSSIISPKTSKRASKIVILSNIALPTLRPDFISEKLNKSIAHDHSYSMTPALKKVHSPYRSPKSPSGFYLKDKPQAASPRNLKLTKTSSVSRQISFQNSPSNIVQRLSVNIQNKLTNMKKLQSPSTDSTTSTIEDNPTRIFVPDVSNNLSDIVESSLQESDRFSKVIVEDITSKRRTFKPPPSVTLKPGKLYRRSLSLLKRSMVIDTEAKQCPSDCICIKCLFRRRTNLNDYTRPSQIIPISNDISHNSSILEIYAKRRSSYVPEPEELINTHLDDSLKSLSISPRKSLIQDQDNSCNELPVVTAKDVVLRRCGQTEPLPFEECYPRSRLQNCQKIGEGVYGEVFLYKNPNGGTTVMKVIPIEGDQIVNGERQKRYDEILSEIVIAMELSNLRNNQNNCTSSFAEVQNVKCVRGRYPERLIDLWDLYDENRGSENDSPAIFTEDQHYMALELANGGQDLESYVFNNAQQVFSMFKQTACALAVAESQLKFEHRDLHWGNVLINTVDKNKSIHYRLNGEDIQVASCGIQVAIIDFTLSRVEFDGVVIFNDLGLDNELFVAKGDYQFEIYRLMQKANGNEWQHFEPYSNILWLHYVLDKVKVLRYKNQKSQVHKEYLSRLMKIKEEILTFQSVAEFVMTMSNFL